MRNMRLDTARESWDPDGAPLEPTMCMTSTEAQNRFGRVLDAVAGNALVAITRYGATKAVVMSAATYQALTGVNLDRPTADSPDLDLLAKEFDELLLQMQRPEAIEGVRAALRAPPEELARIAVAMAQRAQGVPRAR
jgi:prevent-host-death family protein